MQGVYVSCMIRADKRELGVVEIKIVIGPNVLC